MLDKSDPEIRQLALDSFEFGRAIGLDEDKLRCVRTITFDKKPDLKTIKMYFMMNGFSGLTVEPTLDWLKDKGIIRLKDDDMYTLTAEFVEYIGELRPELAV